MPQVGPLDAILPELAHRYGRVRSGLDVGFGDPSVGETLRAFRPGVWMTVDDSLPLPFDDTQFEVVIVAGKAVSREMVREANRVLRSDGCMFFTVDERRGQDEGYSAPEVYRLVREGFDILSVRRPKWWHFGFRGHTLTVCARKKAWREHRGLSHDGVYLFTPFGMRPQR